MPARFFFSIQLSNSRGMTDVPLSHKEVQEASDKMAPLFKKLVSESIRKLGRI